MARNVVSESINNGNTERYYDDGTIEHIYSDGSVVITDTNNNELFSMKYLNEKFYDEEFNEYYNRDYFVVNYKGQEYRLPKYCSDNCTFDFSFNKDTNETTLFVYDANEYNNSTYDFDHQYTKVDFNNGEGIITSFDNEVGVLCKFDKYQIHIYTDNTNDGYKSFPLDRVDYEINGNEIKLKFDNYDETFEYVYCDRRIKTENYYDINGNLYYTSTYQDDGSYVKKYSNGSYEDHSSDGSFVRYEEDGRIRYFDKRKHEYLIIEPDGRELVILDYDQQLLINLENYALTLRPDGTLYDGNNPETNKCIGTYYRDAAGYIHLDIDGRSVIINNSYSIEKIIEENGDIKTFNYDIQSMKTIHNGDEIYSMINHIEYDEDEYDHIMKTMVRLYEDNIDIIDNKYQLINSKFEEVEYSNDISSIKSNIIDNITQIDNIKKIINYSLLAYQTCDQDKVDKANILIDDLFDNEDSNLVKQYINTVNETIEDRNNDSILEYMADTNFDSLASTVIPIYSYTDENGNLFYFNNIRNLLDIKGELTSFDYGGEEFSFSYKDGMVVLKDSNGNDIDIFGEYNLESNQYGGNQCVLGNYSSLLDKNVVQVLDKYFPGTTEEEREALLDKLADTGCGYVAFTNIIFKKMEGKEEEFNNLFGYPMYTISYNGPMLYEDEKPMSVNYNYEPLAIDLYCRYLTHDIDNSFGDDYYLSPSDKISLATEYANGFYEDETAPILLDYAINELGIEALKEKSDEPIVYISSSGYELYTTSGELYCDDGVGHAMIKIGTTDDGRIIVSSWGQKLILDNSDCGHYEETEY